VLLDMSSVIVLLKGGESGSTVVLGSATALLVTEMLAGVGREEP
jgi:hypothetical protein